MNQSNRPHRRKSPSTGRFFVTAVLIAVAIFVVINIVEMEIRPHAPANRQAATPSATAAIAAASDSLKGFQVVLWRKGCAEGCPDYALHYAAGKLHYTGIRGVAKRGNLSVDFDSYHQHRLLKLVEQAAFFSLGNDYSLENKACHPNRTDAPVYIVGVTLNRQTKKIMVNEGCTNVPPRLSKLARNIDTLARSKRWTGIINAPAGATAAGTAR